MFPSATLRRASPQFLVAIAAAPRWPPTDDGDDESFAEGVRRAGSCDHRCSAAGGGTIRGGVGVNIGAAFAVGVIGLLPPPPPPPPPHCGKRRKAVAITAGASVGAIAGAILVAAAAYFVAQRRAPRRRAATSAALAITATTARGRG